MKQTFMILALLFSLQSCASETPEQVLSIEANEVISLIENNDQSYQLIDIRTPEEFQAGHLESAINIPHHLLLSDISLLDQFKEKNLVFYCHSGGRVGKVMSIIIPDHYQGIYHLTGDYRYWKNNNYPIKQ